MFGGHLQCCEEEEGRSVSFWFTIPLECVDTVPPSPSIMMRKQLTVTPDITDQSISYPSYMNDDDNIDHDLDPITDANASNASTFSSAFSSSHNIFSSSSTSSSFSPTSQVYQNTFQCPSPTHAFPSSSSASSRDASPFSRTDHTPLDYGLSSPLGTNRGRGIRVDVGDKEEGQKELNGERGEEGEGGRETDRERGRERGREGREVGSCFESPPKGSQFQSTIFRSCSSTNSEKSSRKMNYKDRDRDKEVEREKEREKEKEKNKKSPRLRILIVDDSSICQKVCVLQSVCLCVCVCLPVCVCVCLCVCVVCVCACLSACVCLCACLPLCVCVYRVSVCLCAFVYLCGLVYV